MAATPSTGVGATPLAGGAEAVARRFSRVFKTPSSGLTGPAAPTRGVCGRASRLYAGQLVDASLDLGIF